MRISDWISDVCSSDLSFGFCSGDSSAAATGTERDASFTQITGPWYARSIFTAVCARDVVAPPISSGSSKPLRSISLATVTISSSDGVIRPDRPMIDRKGVVEGKSVYVRGDAGGR